MVYRNTNTDESPSDESEIKKNTFLIWFGGEGRGGAIGQWMLGGGHPPPTTAQLDAIFKIA